MSIIQAAGSGEVSTGFYKLLLDQSLKFDDGKNNYLTRTPTSVGDRKTFTYSSWVKRGKISADNPTWGITAGTLNNSSNQRTEMRFNSSDQVGIGFNTGSWYESYTNAKFRDTSAWYHFVVAVDMTQSTASDRLKFYVNGVSQTFSAYSVPNQNTDLPINTTLQHAIGEYVAGESSASYQFDGYLAEVNFIDGTALTADSFGETKDGIWIPKDTSGLTFGTNGFHLTFKDDVVSEGFNTVTYTGTGANQSLSGLGFSPAFVWVKVRDGTNNHRLFDVVRGPTKDLISNSTSSESTTSVRLQSFDGDGFTVGTNAEVNASGGDIVAWCWEAGGTPTADNSAGAGATPTSNSVKIDGSNLGSALGGSIAATRLSANTAKGFSIVSFTGTGSNATVAHGLSGAPELIILKNRSITSSWLVRTQVLDADETLLLENVTAPIGTNYWQNTQADSSVFSISTNSEANGSGNNLVAYCWDSISGYSSIGSYSGNGSTTGPTVTTGFLPAWVLIKGTSGASHWQIWDTTRHPSNPNDNRLFPNLTDVEDISSYAIEITATGFQIKHNGSDINTSGNTYLYMAFADTRSAAFFKDVTTNGNHFTPVNLDYRDSVPDVPTNNFATLNSLEPASTSTGTLSEGNLKVAGANYLRRRANWHFGAGGIQSGKWYWEICNVGSSYGTDNGLISSLTEDGGENYLATNKTYFRIGSIYKNYTSGSAVSSGTSYTSGDVAGFALDLDSSTQTIKYYHNNSLIHTDNTISSAPVLVPFNSSTNGTWPDTYYNFGQDSSFAGNKSTENTNADGNGHGSFAYAPPSGYLALCSQNLPDAAIIDGTENFNTLTWTGDGSNPRTLSGLDFTPSFIWHKSRSAASMSSHAIQDIVRGFNTNNNLYTNLTASETAYQNRGVINSVNSTGFRFNENSSDFSTADGLNENNQTFVAWNWLAGTAFSNSAGANGATIASSGQVNTTAGFSIVSYTGANNTGSGTAQTIFHGLSSPPELLIIKERNDTAQWVVGHASLGFANALYLDDTRSVMDDISNFNDTAPTSSVFTVSYGGYVNTNGNTFICYAFHSVEGYCKVGSYVGNGNADGPFVFTGFRPAWIMLKRSDAGTEDWQIVDNKRNAFNGRKSLLLPSASNAEANATNGVDFLSNGFKPRDAIGNYNTSGGTYIYLAFADQPFKFANAE